MDNASEARQRGLAVSAIGVIIISPDGLLVRLIDRAGPWDIIFYRCLFIGVSLALFLLVRYGRGLFQLVRGVGRLTTLSAGLTTASSLGFVGAFTHTLIANALVIIAIAPLFSAVLGWLFIGDRLPLRSWVAIGVAIAGIGLMFGDSLGRGNLIGDLIALATALSLGLNLVILRKAGNRDMTPVICLGSLVGGGIALPLADPLAVTGHDLAILSLLGLVQLPLGIALFISGTRFVPAAEVALLGLIETLLGPFWVWLGVGESPTPEALLAGVVVLGTIAANAALAVRGGQAGRA